jgi:hypothetical protein
VIGLVRERYADFGPTLAPEKLQEYHDIRVATETLRQWMIAAGIWLMALRMCKSESVFSYFHATRSYLERHGRPVAFCSDKAGVFRVNAKTPKAGDGFTQFGRAVSELNIDVICANTPAAKGRVERAHQTLQDRLVKELRLRGISTMEDANAYLPEFAQDYNRRFGRVAVVEYEDGRVSIRFQGAVPTHNRIFGV